MTSSPSLTLHTTTTSLKSQPVPLDQESPPGHQHDDSDQYGSGSLEDESEDEWAEERKAVRYMAESEIEDELEESSSSDQEPLLQQTLPNQAAKSKSIGALLKARSKVDTRPSSAAKGSADEPDRAAAIHQRSQGLKVAEYGGFRKAAEQLSEDDGHEQWPGPSQKMIPPRPHKHAPIEISSKRAVTRKRTVVEVAKVERRDPRFDPLSGAVDEVLHERSYAFLKQQRQAEVERLRQAFSKAKKAGRSQVEVERLEQVLKREENREVQREKVEREKLALRKWKASERAQQQEGKKAFHLKKKDQKEIILADRYQHLAQDKRKLHKAMDRKRKKVDGKEKKSMPMKRTRADGD